MLLSLVRLSCRLTGVDDSDAGVEMATQESAGLASNACDAYSEVGMTQVPHAVPLTPPQLRARSLACAVVASLLLVACATTPRADVPIEQQALAAIQETDAIYLSTLSVAGDLHRAHKLDDATFARVLAVAETVRVAREAAALTLLAYLDALRVATPDKPADSSKLDRDVARLNAAKLTLKAEAPTQ